MKYFTLFITLIAAYYTTAQSNCPCCTSNHSGFDFWLGQWEVADTTGSIIGENTIEKLEGGCVVTERWTGSSGGTGRSMNYYDPSDNSWNQLWISSSGTILKLKGVAEKDKMILTSDVQVGDEGQMFHHRISWTLQQDATVLQLWEILNQEKEVTNEVFKGIYRKKEN